MDEHVLMKYFDRQGSFRLNQGGTILLPRLMYFLI